MIKQHATVLVFVIATAVITSCCRTRTIKIEPIHIEVDAAAQEVAAGDKSTGFLAQAGAKVLEKIITPGTLTGDLMFGCTAFYQSLGRWPKDIDELVARFVEAGESTESFRKIRMIEFKTLANGDLEVTYEAEGPIRASMKLTKPLDDGSQKASPGGDDPQH